MLTDPGKGAAHGPSLRDLMDCARAHGEMTDTSRWLDNLERLMEVAWEIMTPEQHQAFREHADVLAIVDAAGQS
jgi:hypothetical protein